MQMQTTFREKAVIGFRTIKTENATKSATLSANCHPTLILGNTQTIVAKLLE